MSQYLPTGKFKWVKDVCDVSKISYSNKTGYILEVDMEYPKKWHDSHIDHPLPY